ncbi:MAG: alpha/beta hydrolase fold domain-containing protein [Synergistaceae bacterium]|nr:alpha/beta hydrolase fold domain-containing protein [Synergistaceae bacterium]
MGYHAFILNYRITGPALFPKPLDDAANALKKILSLCGSLDINSDGYAVCGFSAGGHLAGALASREPGAVN